MNKKDIAIEFLHLASTGKVRDAFEKYVHLNFTHHNPYFAGDRESLLFAMENSAREFPNKQFTVLRALEDNDLVAVHGKVQLAVDKPEIALMHIFRFKGNFIIEEWEVAQEEPSSSPNKNGVF